MSKRARALIALSVIAASLVGVTLWSALLQYRTYEDPRSDQDRFNIEFGIGVQDDWARVYSPSVEMRFFRNEEQELFLDMDFWLRSGQNADRGGTTTCYYFTPPGTSIVPRYDTGDDGVRSGYDVGDLQLYQKFEDYWVYEQTCKAPEPPDDEDTTTSTISYARFGVSENNYYRTRYREYQLEFDVAGLDGNSGMTHGGSEDQGELIRQTGITVPERVGVTVDSNGWSLESHVPTGLRVDRETSSVVEFSGGSLGTGDEIFGGTPTFTMAKPTGELSLGLVQLFATLFLGIVLDQVVQRLGKPEDVKSEPALTVPPQKRNNPNKNKNKKKRK